MKVRVTKPSSGHIVVSDVPIVPWADQSVELTLTYSDAKYLQDLLLAGIREWQDNNPVTKRFWYSSR